MGLLAVGRMDRGCAISVRKSGRKSGEKAVKIARRMEGSNSPCTSMKGT